MFKKTAHKEMPFLSDERLTALLQKGQNIKICTYIASCKYLYQDRYLCSKIS